MKKNILWIVSILLILSLAFTGCGNNSEEPIDNESTSVTNDAENLDDNTDTEESETDNTEANDAEDDAIKETVNNEPNMDADGNYVYTINNFGLSMEIHTCVNVWDYIHEDYPYDTVDLKGMMEDLGWDSSGEWGTAGYGVYTRSDGYMVRMMPERADSSYKLSTGEYRVGSIWVRPYKTRDLELHCWVATSEGTVEHPYIVEGSYGNGYVSFDQIVVFAKYYDHYRENLDHAIEFPVGWYKYLIP